MSENLTFKVITHHENSFSKSPWPFIVKLHHYGLHYLDLSTASAFPFLPVPGQSAVGGGAALLALAHDAAPQPGLVTLLLVLAGAAALLRLLDLRDLSHLFGAVMNPLLDAILNLNLSEVCFKDPD